MTRRELFIVSAAILGSSMVMLGESVVNLALPHIAATFGAPFASLQWVIDGYNLVLGALILFGGSLGDSMGLRRAYLWSVCAFVVVSLVCAFAWSVTSLVLLRAVLAVAGAVLTPVSLATLNAQLPAAMRGRAIGWWTAATSVVLALGPLVGGYLVDAFSWRAIFLINLPLGLIALLLGISLKSSIAQKLHLDWSGVVLGFISLGSITYGLIEGPQLGWTISTVGALVCGAVFFILFIWWERRAKYPLVDLGLFKNTVFAATNAATFFLYAGFAGFGLVFSVFLQTLGGYSAFEAGATMLPVSILLALFSGRMGAIAQKRGPKLFMTLGPLLCAAGMLLLVHLVPGIAYLTGILPGVLVFGLGLTLTVAPLTAVALRSAPDEKSGIASAINNGVATVGPLIAIALLGLFGSNVYTPAVILCAGLATLAGVISFLFV